MTRRDFIMLAATLRRYHAEPLLISGMADTLAGTNPRFDRARFMRESGMFRNAVTQPPKVGDTYSGEALVNHYAGRPVTADTFQMGAFCEALHREERDWERIESLDLPPAESWREAKAREIRTTRERKAAGVPDARSIYVGRSNPENVFGLDGRTH